MRATSMNHCTIAIGSVTHAMKGQDILTRNHIPSRIIRLKAGETKHGCGYGLSIDCMQIAMAEQLLNAGGVVYGETIGGYE